MIRRNAVLRMFWDGEAAPSVEAPLGDFFGQGWGERYLWASRCRWPPHPPGGTR